ncbi:uncharacterized protein [Primulina eburnea]|uniref:uncharacterized protein n=1 Tax=Primulina eburnea TaxID=1245227 RepID=UPI003C6CA700
MGIEVENTSSPIQTVTMTQSSASTSGPKTSMFTKKPGFVIPKNKLSGSLVPLFRGAKKGDGDTQNEEASNRVERKTKWGPVLTLDATVRKGRASAYQARINQISQQLTLGSLAMDDNQDPLSTSAFEKLSYHQLSQETLEILEVEKREIIGELLKLNPSYKAPPDYKPLLKEANVPIPIKEHPGYNFIALIFCPASDTQKRLEKETGAKIRVYGTKVDKGGKFEVSATDAKETVSSYEDLYVHVSADTFEKIDAAVALIELLITPVSVNTLSASTTLTSIADVRVIADPIQSMPSSFKAPPLVNQGMAQPSTGPLPTRTQSDMPQYPQAWFSAGPTQIPFFRQSGLVPPINYSAPLFGNPVQANSTSMPSFFGPPPVIPASFSLVPQNSSFAASRPQPPIALQPPQIPMAPLPVRSQGNIAMASQNIAMSVAPWMNIPNNMISPIPAPIQSAGGAPLGHPIASLSYGSAPQPQRGFSPLLPPMASESVSSSIGPMQPAIPPVAMRPPSPNIMSGSTPIPFPGTSSASFLQPGMNNSVPAAIPRPQHGSSADFTFQPQRPQNTFSQVSLQSSQPANHNLAPPIQTGHTPLTPPSPLVRPLMNNMNPYQVQSFPRIQVSHQMNQPRQQIFTDLVRSPAAPLVTPRGLPLLGHNTISSGIFQHMQPRNLAPPHIIGNSAGPFPPRAANPINSIPQSHSPAATPHRFPSPHPHFGNDPGKPFSGGTQLTYDPFSPTSASLNPQMSGNAAKLHNEIDPEYEDLMASVGVK